MENTAIIILGTIFTIATFGVMVVFVYLYQKKKQELILIAENERLLLKSKSYKSNILAIEQERSKISKELHDQLGSDLISIQITLEHMMLLQKIPDHRHQLEELQQRVQKVMHSTQDLSKNLYPQTLDKYGLKYSLEEILRRLKEAGSAISAKLYFEEIPVMKLVDLVIYRCVQEMLNNAIKHSESSELSIRIFFQKSDIWVCYSDNGKGIKEQDFRKGSGLVNIHNRVQSVGGQVEIETNTNGLEIAIKIPQSQDE